MLFEQLRVIQVNIGKGVEAAKQQVEVLAREGRGIHVELCLVLPVCQPNPLQRLFVVAIERIGDQLIAQKIRLHDARHFRVVPLLNPGMATVIERAKPPTAMKNHRAGWQGESRKADENKDCSRNSGAFGASREHILAEL